MLGISNEEAGAFGDQMNDYEMLQTVKYGYAMANAMPPVKEVAYQVIDSNENDGVILKYLMHVDNHQFLNNVYK